ncbi:small ribosomal subunit Rsm22 family protein [Micromonospora sp. NPDC048830]|uniref:small ribosomal subunit Rsm22 family protein n=1 Tax=Micromonospora sp. NPDC048830 TaxID=3364257 RepID=UPI0037203395
MADLPDDLRNSLASALTSARAEALSASVRRLMDEYRSDRVGHAPILTSARDVTAYAAYRMPATFAAVRAALDQVARVVPDFRPRRHLDLGGGTGAATWAATQIFPGLETVTVLDQVSEALALGRQLCARADHPALRSATWRQWRFDPSGELPAADLVTVSYVLGELPTEDRSALVARATAAGALVVVIEAGTPAGHERVLDARSTLVGSGHTVLAPCPHQGACPLSGTADWCHFAARVNRSALHRRLKDAQLGYEDEKFSYVAAARRQPLPVGGRILRHPAFRKGLVTLQVCARDDGARQELISKRQGDRYRQARDAEWGDVWPPTD